MKLSRFTVMYIIMLVAQAILGNFLGLTQYLFISFLPALIMMLPPSVTTRQALFIAFFSGLFIDLATESVLGINTIALVPVALLRLILAEALFGGNSNHKEVSVGTLGLAQLSVLLLIQTAIFLIIYLWADRGDFWFSVFKFILSLLASYVCSLGACALMAQSNRR